MSKLDGKFALGGHTLTVNVNTLCDLEEAFGVDDINEVLAKVAGLEQKPSLRTIRTIFAVLLRQEHPEMTEQGAGLLITEVGIEQAAAALGEAMAQAFPADAGDEGNVPKKARRAGTGTKS